MAKKNQKVILENIELQPQVIGYSYKKKSNIGRVIFIFIAFILIIYYINDISVYINNLLGKKSATSIQKLADEEKKGIIKNNKNSEKEELNYYTVDENTEVKLADLILNNFKYNNSIFSFEATNNSNQNIDLTAKKYFLETYNSNKTLLERYKVDIEKINANAKNSFEFSIKNDFEYFVITEKNIDDYPMVTLTESNGVGLLTCSKDIETIIYSFKNDELVSIKHSIVDNNINDTDYNIRKSLIQSKANSYNNMNGITATFNSTVNGYSAIFDILLDQANLSNISEKYYYGYKEYAKVVKFEMQTYGFSCG